MTRERARATQTATTGPGTLMVFRCVITAVATATVTVTLPDGATATGQRIPGLTYTVNSPATVLIQQPAIGPVIPVL